VLVQSFHLAVERNDIDAVRDILDLQLQGFDVDCPNIQDDDKTAVHVCSDKGYHQLLQVLIEAGANVDAVDDQERTPLHWAAISGRQEVRLFRLSCTFVACGSDAADSACVCCLVEVPPFP
jgi:ankyrin repeat protein